MTDKHSHNDSSLNPFLLKKLDDLIRWKAAFDCEGWRQGMTSNSSIFEQTIADSHADNQDMSDHHGL